jgi:hypothetical protein
VDDYRIYMAAEDGVYSLLVTDLVDNNYAATGLTEGVTYSFKV